MRLHTLTLAVAACLFATAAIASPTSPQNGVDYTTLTQPQPVQAVGKKVEVIEFFMYHCPVCNGLEPGFEKWIKNQGDRIQVRRVHYPYTGPNDPEAHLYVTLEALGKVDEMHEKIFKAVHVDRIRLNQDAAIIDWVSKNGIDRNTFVNAWNSFGVQTRMRQLSRVVESYGVNSAPTLIIDGRWMTSPATVRASVKSNNPQDLFQGTLEVATALVAKAAQFK
jgi:thiol:disulfide interchange protein DsbA